ncbi:hypothetical protein [Mycobacterium sp.]|uniref:hypothetical protein n=1 Tax=Mycobacterium sp. TaxID=1785 RepID=UPI002634975F|nr:hypothetical protein [Mycobacterium sp.]
MPTILRANTELVAMAWLAGVTGLTSDMVAAVLPKDTTAWAATGFVTVRAVGGAPGIHVPMRQPVVTVDTWAVRPGSAKPPWFLANHLAELVDVGCRAVDASRTVTLPTNYGTARVHSAYLVSEPRRAYGDQGDYARYTTDLALNWVDLS